MSDVEGVAQQSEGVAAGQPVELDLRVAIEVEGGGGRVVVIRLRPLAARTGNARPRDRGPLSSPLLGELQLAAAGRCRVIGYGGPTGRVGGSWADATLVCPTDELSAVRGAIEALLAGDDEPARRYLMTPPRLVFDTSWEPPDPRF